MLTTCVLQLIPCDELILCRKLAKETASQYPKFLCTHRQLQNLLENPNFLAPIKSQQNYLYARIETYTDAVSRSQSRNASDSH
jgi:hypothetical protein